MNEYTQAFKDGFFGAFRMARTVALGFVKYPVLVLMVLFLFVLEWVERREGVR